MNKIDKTVKKETLFVIEVSLILSVLMQAVFLIIQKWDYTVLTGNLLGFFGACGNFFLMCLSIQSLVNKDEKDAKKRMQLSQAGRMLLLFGIVVLGVVLDCFNTIALVIPILFPRIAVAIRQTMINKTKDNETEN